MRPWVVGWAKRLRPPKLDERRQKRAHQLSVSQGAVGTALARPCRRPTFLADGNCPLSVRLQPFRGAAPERVAVLGAEEAEMTDFARADIGGRHSDDLGLGRRIALAEHFDRRPRRPGIVGEVQRAHRALVVLEVVEERDE
jgi:hypothetical protein